MAVEQSRNVCYKHHVVAQRHHLHLNGWCLVMVHMQGTATEVCWTVDAQRLLSNPIAALICAESAACLLSRL
jgi:hypothetical protein